MFKAYLEGLQHLVEGVPVRAFAVPCTQIYWGHQVGEVHVTGQHKPLPGLGQILHTQQSFTQALRSCIHNNHSPMHPYNRSFIHLSNLFWFVCWVGVLFVWCCIHLFVYSLTHICMRAFICSRIHSQV